MEKKHFKVEILEQKIIIMIDSNKYIDKEINIFIKDIENESELNRGIVSLNKDIIYWFTPFNMEFYHGFIIDIFHNDTLIFNETIRTKGIGGDKIKKQCLFISDLGGMGDAFFVEPLIRKINKIFDQRIIVFTYYPQLFINHPCIDKVVRVYDHHALDEISWNVPKEYLNEELYEIRYVLRWDRDRFGYVPHWHALDLRQYAAFQYGITLKTDELVQHFYPNDFENIEELPDKYVVINPSITGGDRTWGLDKWQKLVDTLNDNNINVVAVGKSTNPTSIAAAPTSYYDLDIKKGLNLCGDPRQDELSQVWHIIDKSDMFIALGGGLLALAGSTRTKILQMGGAGDPMYFMPYRNGIQGYKFYYVEGECKLKCISDPKYTVHYLGLFGNKTLKGDDRLGFCIKYYPEYKCHPSADVVSSEALRILRLP